MKYYKALNDSYDYFSGRGVIAGELLTEKERGRVRYIHDSAFQVVNISSRKTCFVFGIRKEIE